MKKKHYTMSWDIMKAVDVVEQYEQKHGKGQLPHAWLKRIYTGSLLDAVHFGRIPKRNCYGVAFKTLLEDDLGKRIESTVSFKLDTATSLTEIINGISDCKVRHKAGLTTKGWRGAKEEWLKIMDDEWSDYTCIHAEAVVNCLV